MSGKVTGFYYFILVNNIITLWFCYLKDVKKSPSKKQVSKIAETKKFIKSFYEDPFKW